MESQHLSLSDDGLYAITEKGLHNGAICESSLPYSVRLRADKNITIFNQKLKRRAQIQSDIEPRRNGTYTVTLAFNDDDDQPILKMELERYRLDEPGGNIKNKKLDLQLVLNKTDAPHSAPPWANFQRS